MTLTGGISFTAQQRPIQNIAMRTAHPAEMARRNNDALAAKIRVQLPCQVISWDGEKQTIVAQPLIREKIIDRMTGDIKWIALPQLVDVPVCFPQFGNFILTMPPTPGDEVMVVFTDMAFDSWWTRGGIQNWIDRRRHDLSDGIALIGINSLPNLIQDFADDAAELRTQDGMIKIRIEDEKIILKAENTLIEIDKDSAKITSEAITLTTGTSRIEMTDTSIDITGTLKINGQNYALHTHSGVTTGPGASGPVIP